MVRTIHFGRFTLTTAMLCVFVIASSGCGKEQGRRGRRGEVSAAEPGVDVYLKLRNEEENGMGMPLPAGRVRVHKKDPVDNQQEFIGEDIIDHTPKDEDVLLRLGCAFDVVGERKQTNFVRNGNRIDETFEITLRNHRNEDVNVIVKETLYRWINWEIIESRLEYEKQDSRTIHFSVAVPAGGETKITYTVRYTW